MESRKVVPLKKREKRQQGDTQLNRNKEGNCVPVLLCVYNHVHVRKR